MNLRICGNPRNVFSHEAELLLRELAPLGVRRLSPKADAVTGEVSILPFDDGAAFACHFQNAVVLEQSAPGFVTFLSAAEGLALELNEPSRTFAVEGTGILYDGAFSARIAVRAGSPIQGLTISVARLEAHLASWFPERDAAPFIGGIQRYSRAQVGSINRLTTFLLREAGLSPSTSGSVSLARCRAALLDLLIENFEEEDARPEWSVSPRHLKRAEAFVLNNLGADFSVADVATAAGVSARSLYRAFQDFRGLSFSQFVRNARMDASRELLRDEPGMPLKAVARRVGYSDYTSFWRHYRARFGVSPSAGEEWLAA